MAAPEVLPSMVPIPSEPGEALRFVSSATRRHLAQGALLAALLLGAAAGARGLLDPGEQQAAWVCCAALLAVAGLAWRRESLTIDTQAGVYAWRRGWRWPRAERTGPASQIGPLRLHGQERIDPSGLRWTRWAIVAEGLPGKPELFVTDDAGAARDAAERWASALSVPLVESRSQRAAPGRAARLAVGAAATVAALGALSAVLWPAVQRARRPPVRVPIEAAYHLDYQRALVAFEMRNYEVAERLLRRSLRANPPPPNARNLLAYALAEQGRLDEALVEAYGALRAAPDASFILDTVAEMHERRRELQAAARYYEMALKGDRTPELVETHAKYGRTLLAMGKRREAELHLRLAARYPSSRWGSLAARLLRGEAAADDSRALNPRPRLLD